MSCRVLRWLSLAVGLALVPKCVVCAVVYFGVGVALGLGGPELCGGSPAMAGSWALTAVAVSGAGGVVLLGRSRRRRSGAMRLQP